MDLIVAIDKNYGIGRGGRLLFNLPGDLKYFKEKTLGKTVIMGRKTLESLPGGRPLPGRKNVALTRDKAFSAAGVTVAGSVAELKAFSEDAFVIGGAEVYSLLLPYCQRAYITRVDARAEADAFFPQFDKTGNWRLVSESEKMTENGLTYSFQIYENGRPKSFFSGEQAMELVKHGKTKDVFKLDSGDYLLKFKNTVTGNPDGSRDPGGNSVVGEVEGVGEGALRVTAYYFELLKRKGIASHYVSANVKERELIVRPAVVFGSGLEFVCRYKAEGSFVRRFGEYCERGRVLNPPVLEVTLKDDGRDDPPATGEILAALGLMTAEQYADALKQTRVICDEVKADLAARGLELIDIKLEFGLVGGKVCLIDEISAGNMRVFKNGKKLDYNELSALIH